tara:strand:+ start:3674 stop:5545 length:1872 start_codon:yes stop_codon:yes gene_type:complete
MKIALKLILFISVYYKLIGAPISDKNYNASIKTAQMLEKKGDTENAIAIYLDLNKKYPNNYSITRSIKNLYIKTNKYENGILFLKSQLKSQPKKHQNYIDLGEFYLLNNQIEESRKIWEIGIQRFNNKQFYRNLFSIFSRHNLEKDIKNLLNNGRNKFGNSFLSYETGSFYQSKQSYAQAMDEYIIYLLYNKNRQNIIQRRISRMSDDSVAVDIILSKLISISDKQPKKFLFLLADFYFQQQNYNKSFKTYKAWHKTGQWEQKKWLSLANNLRREGQYIIAVDVYNYILKNSKNSNATGKALLGLAKTFENQVIPMKTNNLIPYFFDQNIFFKNYHTETTSISPIHLQNSLSIYDSLLFSLPQSPLLTEAYYRLGTIQYNILQDFDRAQILLKTALKNNPPIILKLKIIDQLSNIYISQGNLNKASDFLSKINDPNSLDIINQKKILIMLLSENIDSAKTLIQFELEVITPNDTYFNDLIELNGFLIRYTQQKNPIELKSFSHFIKSEFLIRQRKITEAIMELKFISDYYSETEIAPLSSLRQALLLKKIQQYDEALKISLTLGETWIADRSIILAGQIYELNFKNKEKAISEYMKILNEHKTSIYAEPIRYHIRELQNITIK